MNRDIKRRLAWVKLYQETEDAGLVCRRCGISRPTLRKWHRRYLLNGESGLKNKSRRPNSSPNRKIFQQQEEWILDLRITRKLGARRIQSELRRQHDFFVGLATIHKTLRKHNVGPLVRIKRKQSYRRYSRPIPGERVQMDTCKITKGMYQYTAIDDCTRYQVIGLFPRRTAKNSLKFLEQVMEEMPFPIQRIQTDRGGEFFAYKFQEKLMECGIKFRPIKPRSPHLNGKVERAQKTDIDEFFSTIDITQPDLSEELVCWQHFYNWQRPHGGIGGKTPIDKCCELSSVTPYWDDVDSMYEPTNERIRLRDYHQDREVDRLKRCL